MRLYTDASTRGSLSGIAYIATTNNHIEIDKKGMVIEQKDNNTAELLAILYAIEDSEKLLRPNEKVILFTDSTYAVNAIRKGHSTRPEEEPLIHKINDMMTARKFSLFWIKGHCQDATVLSYYNKRADKMAKVVRKLREKEITKEKRNKLLKIFMNKKGFTK